MPNKFEIERFVSEIIISMTKLRPQEDLPGAGVDLAHLFRLCALLSQGDWTVCKLKLEDSDYPLSYSQNYGIILGVPVIMEQSDCDKYEREVECNYKHETYSVRDNGCVRRHRKKGTRSRRLDEKWTSGRPNNQSHYLEIASVSIHRIVATAFHGPPPNKERIIVDHIDTNKKNNRPENLRWVTRYENVLMNPITVKRIESVCGVSIEEFLKNPQDYRDKLANAPTDISWMRAVNQKEAAASLKNLTDWANSDKPNLGGTLGDWVFRDRVTDYSEERLEEIIQRIEKRTRINRKALFHNKTKRGKYYHARWYAVELLRSELNLSDREIGEIVGLSPHTVRLHFERIAIYQGTDFKSSKSL